tara:strand:+ start:840 stop:2240 length:1401 start_codon:yes stop_codon:yes gene_type:complete
MKFFICKDSKKFTMQKYDTFGEWCFYRDDEVKLYKGQDYIVLYTGYLIEGDIEEACARWSFDNENGNFFAIKLTRDRFYIALDYFQNHKIFVARKYGTEISNHVPFMTCNPDDVNKTYLEYGQKDAQSREFSPEENTTFFEHVTSYIPSYDYVNDCKLALEEEKWTDIDALAEYIDKCMLSHADLIKSRYKNRFISLSEGIDSALQSQYFYNDPQYVYDMFPCHAGEDGRKYKEIAANNFPNVTHEQFDTCKAIEITHKYLKDGSTRWASILPTFKQISDCKVKPDIVMYGVNGDEMFFRDLIPHLHMLLVEHKGERYIEAAIQNIIDEKTHHYGACYTLGTHKTTQTYLDEWFEEWVTEDIDWENAEHNMLKLLTPKLYTRSISANNDVLTASLYNDRRIYHEVFKTPKSFLLGDSMDSPIQRMLLRKWDYEFVTPHKDMLYAVYEGIFYNIFNATYQRDIAQNI